MYFLSFRILNNLHLPWKKEFALKIFTPLNIVFTFRTFEQLDLALKNRVCPEFTVLNTYFYHSEYWTNLRLHWKTEFARKFFTVLKYFLSFSIFEQLDLALKTEFALNFSSQGSVAPPPPRTPLPATILLPEGRSGPFRLTFTSTLMRSLMTLYSAIDRELWTNFSSKATTAALAVSVILQFLFEKI